MNGSRYPSRTRTRVYSTGQLSTIAQNQLEVGFNQFRAKEEMGGSSSMDCSARLHYVIGDGISSLQFSHVEGSTGKGYGHAEMHALHRFWTEICAFDLPTFVSYRKMVQCESKPCCVRCSAVLGLLGIAALDEDTKKSRNAMGSTEWAISADVRDLLQQVTAQPKDAFTSFGSLTL